MIFLPGVLTAQTSPTFGRGVGMDVVKSSIEKIAAWPTSSASPARALRSRSRFRYLAIIPSGRCQWRRGASHPSGKSARTHPAGRRFGTERIEHVQGTPVYRRRGSLLPIV